MASTTPVRVRKDNKEYLQRKREEYGLSSLTETINVLFKRMRSYEEKANSNQKRRKKSVYDFDW